MRISQIEIYNFRSIKELVINPGNLCALIGPNSTGKTNVLKALDLVLGEGWTTKAKIAREQFNDSTEEIFIKIDFSDAVSWIYYAQTKLIRTVTLQMKLEPLECNVRLWENYPNDKGGEGYFMNDDFKKSCHFILIHSERQLSSELRMSQWTMLGKLMKLVYANYISKYGGDEQNLKDTFSEKIKPAKEFLEDDFSTENVTYRKFVDSFKKHCKENSAGLANEFDPVLDIYNLNWFYKTLQIHVKERFPDRHFDSDEVGAGMQNLLLISIFQTYAELMGGKVIFGIEEPEIYLYPQAQRSLYKNFIALSEHTQIFYTTHNPNFVDAARPEDAILLRKDQEQGTFALEKDPTFNTENAERLKYKIYTHFNPERNELFFARKVLFVEGDSDKILFSTLCEKHWNLDLDEMGVSIIACGGKASVSYFVGVCNLIGFEDYFAVWDKDRDLERSELLDNAKNVGKGLELEPNIEGFLGLPAGDDAKKVKNAHEWALNTGVVIPEEFESIKKFLEHKEILSTESESSEIMPKEMMGLSATPF